MLGDRDAIFGKKIVYLIKEKGSIGWINTGKKSTEWDWNFVRFAFETLVFSFGRWQIIYYIIIELKGTF